MAACHTRLLSKERSDSLTPQSASKSSSYARPLFGDVSVAAAAAAAAAAVSELSLETYVCAKVREEGDLAVETADGAVREAAGDTGELEGAVLTAIASAMAGCSFD